MILFLGPVSSPVHQYLCDVEPKVVSLEEPLDAAGVAETGADFAISHGYRHRLGPAVIAALPDRLVNLHISFLPWNRGADPNLWSFVENTPQGVSIHYVDEGLDTGDLIAQTAVAFSEEDTLRTSYDRLQCAVLELFIQHWASIRAGTCARQPQPQCGSFHRLKDRSRLAHLLAEKGWDTPVESLIRHAVQTQYSPMRSEGTLALPPTSATSSSRR